MLKFKLILIFLTIFLSSLSLYSSVPVLKIEDYKPVDFTGSKSALIEKGDNPAFKELSYDDKNWKIVSLPSNWQDVYPGWTGICWYRIHIKFPAGLPDRAIAVELGTISDVDQVYLNGQLIGASGKFPPARESSYDKKRIYEIPTKLIKEDSVNIMALRVSGLFAHEAGPYKGRFQIADFQELYRNYLLHEFFELFFIITYLAMGIYFLIIFAGVSLEKEYLFFSLLTLSVAFYLFLRTQIKYFIISDFLFLKRIEYLLLFSILLLMLEYFTFLLKRKHFYMHYIYYAVTSICLSLVIISDHPPFWNKVLYFAVQPAWLIPILYCLYISVKEFKNEVDNKYILSAFYFIWLVFLNDLLVDRGIIDFIRISNYVFWVVIAGIAFVMRRRFLRLYHEVLDLREKKRLKLPVAQETKIKLDKAIAYLKENFSSDISREGLAGEVGMHYDYFGKLFKLYTGKTINEYINELRIGRACELLLKKEESITDIAFAVGFESLSTFYRVFQKIKGEAPSVYMEANRKNSA